MVRVKLCGLMNDRDVAAAEAAGADAVGFVTEYPVPVPWNLDRERARELARLVSPFVTTVAVVGGPVEEMVAIALTVRPKILQLHGDESLDDIMEVVQALDETGIKVIKALRVEVDTGQARFEETDPVLAGSALVGSGIVALIVDSVTSERPAGTGVSLDWKLAARMGEEINCPLILAGGLNAGNVAEAVSRVHPYAVDVITGGEWAPGVKDPARMAAFVRAAKGWGN